MTERGEVGRVGELDRGTLGCPGCLRNPWQLTERSNEVQVDGSSNFIFTLCFALRAFQKARMLLQTTRDIVGHLKVARCARRHPSLPTPTTTTGTSPNPPLQSLSTSSTHKLRSLIYPTPAPPLCTSLLISKCAHAHHSLAQQRRSSIRSRSFFC